MVAPRPREVPSNTPFTNRKYSQVYPHLALDGHEADCVPESQGNRREVGPDGRGPHRPSERQRRSAVRRGPPVSPGSGRRDESSFRRGLFLLGRDTAHSKAARSDSRLRDVANRIWRRLLRWIANPPVRTDARAMCPSRGSTAPFRTPLRALVRKSKYI